MRIGYRKGIHQDGPQGLESWWGSSGRLEVSAPGGPAHRGTQSRRRTWRWPCGWWAVAAPRSVAGQSRSAFHTASQRPWDCWRRWRSAVESLSSCAQTRWSDKNNFVTLQHKVHILKDYKSIGFQKIQHKFDDRCMLELTNLGTPYKFYSLRILTIPPCTGLLIYIRTYLL